MSSVGQRAAKLLAINVGGLKKVCPPAPLEAVSPGSMPGPLQSFSKFDGR